MAKKILAVLEQRENKLKKVSFEVAAIANKISKELNILAEAVIVGSDISNIEEIKNYGLSRITFLKNQEFLNYSSSGYRDAIIDFVKESDVDILIMGNTALGNDLAPRLAVKLNSGCIMDCISLKAESGEITAVKPVYAGKANITLKINTDKKVFTIRPNVFKTEVTDSNTDIIVKEITNPNLKTKVVSFKKSEGKLDVAEADIIVSGGRGMKAPENFALIETLADELGAAVGASRAVVDAGWRPHREQVGQTGKTVSPSLYIACGISGAIQHLAGMSSSKYIVAINKDKDAPIFSVADYGITGDVMEVLPVFTEEIKKLHS